MNRWEEQFNNHAIHETLKWTRDCVSTNSADIYSNDVIEKRRFLKIISKYEEVLQKIDPELIPLNQIDSLNNGLRHQNISAQLTAYKENGNVAHLTNANDNITNQLTALSLLLSLSEPELTLKPVKELEKLIDTSTQTLIEKKDKIVTSYKALEENMEDKKLQLLELEDVIKENKTQVNSHITEWQNQFSMAQDARSQSFNTWKDDFVSEKTDVIDEIIENNKKSIEGEKVFYINELDEILKDGKSKHESILELYELTAGDSVGAGYIKSADDEKKQADKWRVISIVFIALTVAWMLFAYSKTQVEYDYLSNIKHNITTSDKNKDTTKDKVNEAAKMPILPSLNINKSEKFPWFKLFITFSLSGVLLWGSAYAAQQSTKHRKNEKRTRWFALEVKAIDPFISSLDPAQKNELKKQFSERIFGQFSNSEDDNTKVIDEHVFKLVADSIGGIISKIPK